jgi:protein mago nashi
MEAPADSDAASFYLRYYVGHKGRFGHEFMEFEIRPDGRFRYANGSLYKGDGMIRKEARVHVAIVDEVKRIIRESAILKADDSLWPEPDRVGRQELEVVLDGEHICFTCSKLGTQAEIEATQDPEGCVGIKSGSRVALARALPPSRVFTHARPPHWPPPPPPLPLSAQLEGLLLFGAGLEVPRIFAHFDAF